MYFLNDKDIVWVKISYKSFMLKFIPCGPECISKGCVSKCCDAPTHPDGMRVHVSKSEAAVLKKLYGTKTKNGFIQPKEGCRVCPFKLENYLCGLWQNPARPFGCIVSPFALNKNNTLIIRNRYKLLPCYDSENGQPAYITFRSSLEALFKEDQILFIEKQILNKKDFRMPMHHAIHEKLVERETDLKNAS